jgi:hypothetical protein
VVDPSSPAPLTSTANSDTIRGTDATYNTGDEINGGGGVDFLELILTAANTSLVDMSSVERIFIRNTSNNNTVDAVGFTGYTQLWYDRGTQELTVENVAELATIGFTGGDGVGSDSDFTVEPEAELIEGDDDTVTIALNDAEGNDLTIEDGGEGFENINIALEGDNVLNSITSQDSQSVTITGTGSLDLDDEIAGVDAVDASSASGDISMVMANEDVTVTTGSGDDEIEFGTGEFTDDDTVNLGDGDDTVAVTLNSSVNQPADVTNTEILSIQGDDDGNAENFTFDIGGFDPLTTVRFESQGTTVTADTILIDDAEFGFGVEYRGDGNDANQSFDNFTFDFTGAGGSDDTLAISFNNQGEDLDDNSRTVTANTLDIDDIENLEISLGDGGVVTLAAINGQEVEGVTVDNPGDEVFTITAALESTEVTSVDASGSAGGVSVSAANSTEDCEMIGGDGDDTFTSGTGEDTLTGGAGDDTLAGGGGIDVISGGDDDDTLIGGDAIDELTGGDGADTFQFNGDNANETDADLIEGFTVGGGNDILAIDVSAAGGGIAANLADGALVAVAASADNSFIVDSAGTGYASFALAEAAVEAANGNTLDYALLFFNTTNSRIELYIDADSGAAGAGVLLAAFEDIDNDTDADTFLGDFTAGNYDSF